jgi:hypothetical protein
MTKGKMAVITLNGTDRVCSARQFENAIYSAFLQNFHPDVLLPSR